MAVTGRFVAKVLAGLSASAEPGGVNLLDLERRARRMVEERGAVSCYWDYSPSFGRGPFRNVICLSVDDAVLHGMPHDHVLADGALLTLDFRPRRAARRRVGRGMPLHPGLALGIEPWWSATSDELVVDADGWTLRFVDGSRGARSEHTIAVTEDGPRVLTVLG